MAVIRGDFKEEGTHQWVMNYQTTGNNPRSYRFVVRQADGELEIIIRAKIENDPTEAQWERALATINTFIKRERIGEYRQGNPQEPK